MALTDRMGRKRSSLAIHGPVLYKIDKGVNMLTDDVDDRAGGKSKWGSRYNSRGRCGDAKTNNKMTSGSYY